MADLDSFFAKKDKRKVKGKKFTSTDEIARRLEETEKKLEKDYQKETPVKVAVEEVAVESSDGVVTVVEVKPPKKVSMVHIQGGKRRPNFSFSQYENRRFYTSFTVLYRLRVKCKTKLII